MHSNTTLKPSGAEKRESTVLARSLACFSCSSCVACGCECEWAEGGLGRQNTSSAKPLSLAKAKRAGLMSTATTRHAPVCLASAQANRPIVPTPNTKTDWPASSLQRRDAWITTESGSAREASSNEQLSGNLYCFILSCDIGLMDTENIRMKDMGWMVELCLEGPVNMGEASR